MPDKINTMFAFGLSPKNAEDYFRSKGYAFSWNWRDVFQEQHNKAFTVAKVMKLDVLTDIQELVDKAISGKITTAEFYKQLEPKLRAKGWWGKQEQINPKTGEVETVQLGSPWRLKKILETNMNVSYSAGRYKTQIDAASFAPWWQYFDMDDARVRIVHDKIGDFFVGKVLHFKNPWWQIWYPPNDWGCRCWIRNWTEEQRLERNLEIIEELPQWLLDLQPGEGWAHNPGAAFNPDLTKYSAELVKGIGLSREIGF